MKRSDPTPQRPASPVADTTAAQTPADEWLQFADALERGNMEAARRFLAEQQLPAALAPVLAMIRPEAARLQAVIDADVPQAQIEAAEIHLNMLMQAHPATVEDAATIGAKAAALTVEVRDMKRRHDDAAFAKDALAGLHNVFNELLTGVAGKKACGTLNMTISNALRAAGFDAQALYSKPWQEVFRLQVGGKPARRKRLHAVR